jgi:thiamine biosynthesis protein ThiS
MKLQINGEPRDFNPPLTLAGLVDQLGMKTDRVAIELNRSIVARDLWAKTSLAEGDCLEIVQFVGGGSENRQLITERPSASELNLRISLKELA